MVLARITDPDIEPISVADAKAHLRLEHEDDDLIVAALISAARLHIERITSKMTIHQTWRFYLDVLPYDCTVILPISPISQIMKVQLYGPDGVPETLNNDTYIVDLSSNPARMKFNAKAGFSSLREFNGIEIDFVAGYGATSLDVPNDLKQAILLLVAHWYENRSAVSNISSVAPIPVGVQELLQPYRSLSL